MITFNLEDGRVIRVRQKKLGGPLTVTLLGEYNADSRYREMEKEIKMDPGELLGIFAKKLGVLDEKTLKNMQNDMQIEMNIHGVIEK